MKKIHITILGFEDRLAARLERKIRAATSGSGRKVEIDIGHGRSMTPYMRMEIVRDSFNALDNMVVFLQIVRVLNRFKKLMRRQVVQSVQYTFPISRSRLKKKA